MCSDRAQGARQTLAQIFAVEELHRDVRRPLPEPVVHDGHHVRAAELSCRSCGATTVLADRFLIACDSCDGADVEVVHGEELVVASLDLAEPASAVRS